jgi:hypothetical protein
MTDRILFEMAEGQLRPLLRQTPVPPGAAPLDRQEATGLVRACAWSLASMRQLWEIAYRSLFTSPPPTFAEARETREVLDRVFADRIDAAEKILALAADAAARTGQPIPETEGLASAAEDVRRLRRELAERWPVCTDDEMEEVRRQIARGEGMELDDAFAAIAGVGVEEWRRRVEARRKERSA